MRVAGFLTVTTLLLGWWPQMALTVTQLQMALNWKANTKVYNIVRHFRMNLSNNVKLYNLSHGLSLHTLLYSLNISNTNFPITTINRCLLKTFCVQCIQKTNFMLFIYLKKSFYLLALFLLYLLSTWNFLVFRFVYWFALKYAFFVFFVYVYVCFLFYFPFRIDRCSRTLSCAFVSCCCCCLFSSSFSFSLSLSLSISHFN